MSIFNRRYDIDKELAILYEELRTISELKEFVQHPTWIKLRGMMLDKMIAYGDSIVSLSSDVEKNKEEIRHKSSLRTACKGLIEGIETTLNAENEIKQKILKLEEATMIADRNSDNLLK